MDKKVILDSGVTENQLDLIYDMYFSDLRKIEDYYQGEAKQAEDTRAAITAMIQVISNPATLKRILKFVNTAYYKDDEMKCP